MRANALVIHLAAAVRRRPQVDALLSRLPLPASVLDAVNGRLLSDEEVAVVYRPGTVHPRYPFALRRTEIGCFLSHRQAWRAIAEGGLDAGLIVEDDVELDDAVFGETLALALTAMRPGDYVRFPYRPYTDKGREVAAKGASRLIEPSHVGLGMQVQLVGREAARRLLDVTATFDRPVDALIQMRWLTGLRTLAARPSGVSEIGARLGGTLVQKKAKPPGEVVLRELARLLYRSRLRLASWRAPL